jgi:glycosyltransferase involved in cell wall biosynthesis
MPNRPKLSVIIPSYNEMKNIQRGVLDEVLKYLKKQTYTWEIVLSDDGSTDGTLDYLKKFARKDEHIRVLANKHAGKAQTGRRGMLIAKGQWRLFTDFDQSTPLKEVEKLWQYTPRGYAVIIGSREMIGSKRDQEPWYRHLMGRSFNLVVQMFAVPGILDTQCGFKLLSAPATETLFNRLVIYGPETKYKGAFTGAFDVELLFLAYKLGFKVREVPIEWAHHETDRVSPIKDSLRMFRDILRIRLVF